MSDNTSTQIENLETAHSTLADTDYVATASNLVKSQAQQQYQVAILAQANQSPREVLKLSGLSKNNAMLRQQAKISHWVTCPSLVEVSLDVRPGKYIFTK